jgi:hypothetical protein
MRVGVSGILLLSFLFLFPFFVFGAGPLDVVLNEIAWMGTKASANDEWIELYNNTDKNINLEGWILRAKNGLPEIKLKGKIPAKGFYLLERTDDRTIPDVLADQIYKGGLRNSGESLELYDNFGNLVDKVDCGSGWFAGANLTKQTMERKNPKLSGDRTDNWQTSQSPGGTPKTKNSQIKKVKPKNQILLTSKNKTDSKFLFVVVIGFLQAIFFSTMTIILKLKLLGFSDKMGI